MEQNNIPQLSNLPGYRNFVYTVALDEYKDNISLPITSYHSDVSESANSFFARDFSWEYFSNELEFE